MEIDFRQLVRATLRLWKLPIIFGLVLAIIGVSASLIMPTTYSATTQLLVTKQITGSTVFGEAPSASTYIALAKSGPVLDSVILELGLDDTREELLKKISFTATGGGQFIEVTVTTSDPQLSADIANTLSRTFVSNASNLSLGELQRSLDDMRSQSNTIRDRVVVIDTRLAEIDTEENVGNSEAQAEITQLKRERLTLSQTLADLDRTIRSLNTELSTASLPVIINDYALPDDTGEGTSPILLGLIGIFLGGLAGVAWIIYSAFTDRVVRDASQIESLPILASLNVRTPKERQSHQLDMLAARVLAARKPGSQSLSLIAPRVNDSSSAVLTELKGKLDAEFQPVIVVNGMLDSAESLGAATSVDMALVIATLSQSKLEDLGEVADILQNSSVFHLGTMVLK